MTCSHSNGTLSETFVRVQIDETNNSFSVSKLIFSIAVLIYKAGDKKEKLSEFNIFTQKKTSMMFFLSLGLGLNAAVVGRTCHSLNQGLMKTKSTSLNENVIKSVLYIICNLKNCASHPTHNFYALGKLNDLNLKDFPPYFKYFPNKNHLFSPKPFIICLKKIYIGR